MRDGCLGDTGQSLGGQAAMMSPWAGRDFGKLPKLRGSFTVRAISHVMLSKSSLPIGVLRVGDTIRPRKVIATRLLPLFAILLAATSLPTLGQVVISEIMYHPVEEPAFNASGTPVLDLYEDVHEFVEIHNPGAVPLSLAGWKLSGGVSYTFPSNAVIQAGEYRVIARDPARLAAVAAYGLAAPNLLGPYTNQLSNRKDTLRIRNADDDVVDAVSYSAEFPWAISADALGAGQEWTGLNPLSYQYRGRSLERVSFTHPANDPANWLASPLPGNPSPGRTNAVSRAVPKPVVVG